MMSSSRKTANSIVLKVVFGIVIASLILTSMSGYLISSGHNYAVKVNGQEISREQFESAFASEQSRMQLMINQLYDLSANEVYIKSLRQKTLNTLIDKVLLDQYARKLRLGISDKQVKNAIFSNQAFQTNGKFNNARYNSIVNQIGVSADQYAQVLRNQLIIQQLLTSVINTDFMLKGEVDDLVALISQQRVVRETTIDISKLAIKQQVNDNEVEAYYEKNKTSFMTPEQFRISYIELDSTVISETVSDGEIQYYYDQHQDDFIQGQRNHYSVIQTKTRSDAEVVLKELNNGADFAIVAKDKSTDIISAKSGGDVGWLEEVALPEEFKNAGLKNRGQLSDIIKSSVGFLIVRLNDVQPAKTKPLTEVRDDITAKVKQIKMMNAYAALQHKANDITSNNNNDDLFASIEQVIGVKAIKTGWFGRDNLPQELNFKPVVDAIFNGDLKSTNCKSGNNSDLITVDDNRAFVLRVDEYKPEAVKPLSTVKDQILMLVKHNKAELQAKMDAEKLLAELKAGRSDDALKIAGLSFGLTKTLSRTDQDPISKATFRLSPPSKNKPSYGIAYDMQGNVVLLELDEINTGALSEDQKKVMAKSIIQNNSQILFEALMSNLRKKAKIKFGDTII